MDEHTRRFYDRFAGELAEQYEAAQPEVENLIRAAFAPGMRVLDVGAGSGRDLAFLLEMGCDACGVEPSAEMRALALKRHPQLAGRLESAELPHLDRPFGGHFEGVLCSGVLNHVAEEELAEAIVSMRDLLEDGGRLLLTISTEPLDVDENHRDQHGRLITPLDPEQLRLLFDQAGLSVLNEWGFQDALNRKGYSWCGLLLGALYIEREI